MYDAHARAHLTVYECSCHDHAHTHAQCLLAPGMEWGYLHGR